ncbi:MAG: helix-turn-helix transcriptional regulator [Oscillospiraceae bacterium]|nr:helix-turn-helix transcriptional regulator [Oscillospiraceae bacterium]
MNEFERVEYPVLRHVNVFLNSIVYRSAHFHGEFELLCLFGGTCSVKIGGDQVRAKKGDIIFVNHSEAHEILSVESADFIILQLSRHLFRDYWPALRALRLEAPLVTDFLSEEEKRQAWGLVMGCAREYLERREGYEAACLGAIGSLLALILRSCPHTLATDREYAERRRALHRMERLQEAVAERYSEKLTLEELAAAEGVTVTYLSHFFTEHFGRSFRQYLQDVRFENALLLMEKGALNAGEIALSCGFSDPKYMSRMFRERFGVTPAVYMASALPSPSRPVTAPHTERRYSDEDSLKMLRELEAVI